MAGGPIFPFSAVPVTAGRVFPYVFIGDGSQDDNEEMLGVEASVGADSTWVLWFQMPPSLPTGTAKLVLEPRADATTGNAKVNPAWASIAVGEDPSTTPTVTAEGTTTVEWSTNDDDEVQQVKIDLDADTVTASERILMHLVFETTDWTLAAVSGWQAYIIWE